MPAPIPVILNANAGLGHPRDEIEKLSELFRAAGAQAKVHPARNGDDLVELARRLARDKPPVIVAGGGDGTINAVASALVGTDIALGVLPLGTLNHFAKDLGIAAELDQAVRDIVAGHSSRVDVGEVNGRIFLNNSSIGLYPVLVIHREKQRRRLGRGKWHALFWATLTVLRRSPFLDVRLALDGREEQRRASFIFIGNNAYEMEGFNIGSRPRLDGGALSLYATHRRGRWSLLGLALRALFGRLHQADDFDAYTAHSVRLDTRHKRLPVATDGEVTPMDLPLDYRIRPRALRVVVPRRDAAPAA